MENLRLPLLAALGICFVIWYQTWQEDYAPKPASRSQVQQASEARAQAQQDESDVPTAQNSEDEVFEETYENLSTNLVQGRKVRIITDVYDIQLDTNGGILSQGDLLQHSQQLIEDGEADPFRLLNDELPYRFRVEGGLVASQGETISHKSLFQAAKSEYQLADGENTLVVPVTHVTAKGIQVTKEYIFTRGSYEIQLNQRLSNNSGTLWIGNQYGQLVRTEETNVEEPPFIQTFNGAAIYAAEKEETFKFEKYDFDDLKEEKASVRSEAGWIAMIQHYFIGAFIPPADENHHYTAFSKSNGNFIVRYAAPRTEIEAGASQEFKSRLFLGPKLQQEMGDVAPGLELTIDYGILTPLSKPLFWLLNELYKIVSNWGIAIILITVIIKLAFAWLSAKQYRSMAKMRKFAPRIQTLRERHKDDRQKMQQAMMELYKKEKFNPLGGCLPMLVQMPIFIALYWVLLESVELRHAPFFLWITDLTAADPYYVLPLMMGAVMLLQQKMSSSAMTMDPMQQKMMNIMPLMFTVFFAFFPAGLVLYWFMNTLLGILQQAWINRQMDAAE